MSIYLTYMIGWVRWFPLESRKTGNLTKNKKERPKLPPPHDTMGCHTRRRAEDGDV